MANFVFSFPVADEGGKKSVVSGHIVAADLAAFTARMTALLPLVDAITDGVITQEISVTQSVTLALGGLKSAAGVGTNVKHKGKFTFASADGFPKLISIPAFDSVNFGTPEQAVDIDAQPVIDLVAEFTGGGYSTSHWEDLTSLVKTAET